MKYFRRFLEPRKTLSRWVDPRLMKLDLAQVEAYLHSRGWKRLEPDRPNVLVYAEPSGVAEPLVQFLPVNAVEKEFTQWMFDTIAGIAEFENRAATDVLTDILACPNGDHSVNGAAKSAQTSDPAAA
jgi:hypothetical protein